MNKVVLMGRLTKDPEVRYSNSDTPTVIVSYTLAVKRTYSKSNESDADFINIVAFGKRGEFAQKYFSKGQMVSIAGRIHQDIWEDTEHVKHTRFEIIADEQKSFGRREERMVSEPIDEVDAEVAVAGAMEADPIQSIER